jgi:hypothetical protein
MAVWATQRVPDQPQLHRKTLSQKQKKKKRERERKKEE